LIGEALLIATFQRHRRYHDLPRAEGGIMHGQVRSCANDLRRRFS
jgi:hypothetical protein